MASSSNKFPVKLYNILQEAEKTPHLAEILSWSADGKSFKVHQKDEFSKSILPTTFGTNVYKSFQRNLHFWGYQNIRKGPSKGVCSHLFFVRDRPELLSKMRRVRAPSKNNDLDSRSNDIAQHVEDARDVEERGGVSALMPGRGISGRVVSPNMSSSPSAQGAASLQESSKPIASALSSVHSPAGFLGGSTTSNSAALLLLLQQQQKLHQNKEQDDLQEQQQHHQQHALAETLLVRHLLAQKEQQRLQQMRLIQDLLATNVGQIQQPSVPSSDSDQNALARTLVSHLFQQPVPHASPTSLLSSLLG